jgi:hypothetical protein
MTRALALLLCAACLVLPTTASAKPKVALTQIEGDATGDVRDAVAEAIEGKELALIGSREVNRAVDKLGDLADLTEKDFKKLANELEADAIVAGKLDKVGTAKTLRFRLFVHKKMAKGFTVSFKDPKSEKFRSMLHDKMLDKIGAAGGAEDDDAKPATKKKKAAEDEEDPLATKKDKKAKKSKASEDDEAKPAKKGKLAKSDAKAEEEDARPAKKTAKAEDEDARPAKKTAKADDEDARPAKKMAKAEDEDAKPAKKKADAEDEDRPARKARADEDAKADDAAKSDDDDAPRRAKKKVAAADDGEELEVSASAGRSSGARPASRAAIRLDIGASVQQRSFKFNSNVAGVPRNVAMSPVPGARLDGEFYPLGMSSSGGALAGLGLGFEYDRTLSYNLTTTNNMMSYNVPVKQSHYSIGLRYRLALGKSDTSPTLTVGAGYGKRLFSTDRSKLAADPQAILNVRRDTPESEYTVIDPGLMFRLPVTRMVAFSIGGNGLIVPKAGPIAEKESYGLAKVYGAEAIAAVDVILGSHFALRFAGEFVQVGFTFKGGGQLSNGLDAAMDLSSQEVGGLADRSIGGTATLALLY